MNVTIAGAKDTNEAASFFLDPDGIFALKVHH